MISMNWVKDYVDIKNENLEELADKVTKAGINVEHVIVNNINNLVIGEVLECVNHPKSDHLKICSVNVGNEKKQIVCGAPNVKNNIKVIVALPGAKLPSGEIKKEKKLGVDSEGMICSLSEIGLEEENEENYKKGIKILSKSAPVGEDAFKYLKLDDVLYDLDTHKHKNNDCLYHIGFAYEVATILGKKVKLPTSNFKEIEKNVNEFVKLKIDTKKCTYYKAKMVSNLKIGDSPDFIKKRLLSCGMRPINNIVDISNYVMLEYGQPLHFFDYEKIGNKIVVRMADENEKVVTLDNKERVLTNNDIVIANSDNKVIAIAGIMGSLNSEVDGNTTTLLIESAIFNPVNIRRTARRLDLRSEAAIRYEKGLNFEYTDLALERACYLLKKYAGGEVLSGTLSYDNEDKIEKKIKFTTEKINSLLGINLTDKDIETQIKKLDFKYTKNKNLFEVIIPRRRLDIEENANDIAEEIGRLYGYHNLKNTMPILPVREGKYEQKILIRKSISKKMRSLGLNEVRTYSIVDERNANMFDDNHRLILLPNPMSKDRNALRKSIIPAMLDVIRYNKSRGLKDINIYEVGKVFYDDFKEENHLAVCLYGDYISNKWQGKSIKNDFYVLKGIVENLLTYLGAISDCNFVISSEKSLHPGISADIMFKDKKIGFFGKVHPRVSKEDIYVFELFFDRIDKKVESIMYKQASKFPNIKKDLAFVMPIDMPNEKVIKTIKNSANDLLKDVITFDVYMNDKIGIGKKSIAYTLVFEDSSRTLTENEVMKEVNNIINEVEKKINIKLRDE